MLSQIRMGASALFSALNALPWENDDGDSSDSDGIDDDEDDDESAQSAAHQRMGKSLSPQRAERPKSQSTSTPPFSPASADST